VHSPMMPNTAKIMNSLSVVHLPYTSMTREFLTQTKLPPFSTMS
jgi:hypothetical protein